MLKRHEDGKMRGFKHSLAKITSVLTVLGKSRR